MRKVLYFFALPLVVACGGPSEVDVEKEAQELAEKMHGHHAEKVKHLEVDESLVGVITTEEATNIFNAYLPVKDALVASDPVKAAEHALVLAKLIHDGENKILHDLYIESDVLSKETDLETQRHTFDRLSNHLTLILNANPPVNGAIYQYCPMAFNDRGAYWLSDSKKIMNPYFGDEMLHCGNVEAEIK